MKPIYERGVIVVTGASSGLGKAIAKSLVAVGQEVIGIDLKLGHDVSKPETLPSELIGPDVRGLINCAGINANDWFEDATIEQFDKVMSVNARALMTTTQWLLPQLKANKGFVLNIVSNASHMPMTSSLAYNASKGAADIITRQMARELTKKYGITVFGISPNKLRGTEMSRQIEADVQRVRGWSHEQAEAYQLQSLLAGEETDPEALAEFIGFLVSSKKRHKYLAGCILPYGL